MKRTALTRTKAMRKRSSRATTLKRRETPGGFTREDFYAEAVRQRVCAVTGRSGSRRGEQPPWQAHHATYEAHVAAEGGDIWDPRNCLRLATFIHKRQHSTKPIPLRCLLDQNIEFAFELMGAAAYVYLTRHYEGHDERVELALAELEAA